MGIASSGIASPAHDVTLSGFMMGSKEITNAQYAAFLNAAKSGGEIQMNGINPEGKTGPWTGERYLQTGTGSTSGYNKCLIVYDSTTNLFSAISGYENYPAVYVSWYGAKAFALYYGFDLPTEAEWEYACRGGKQYNYGTDDGTINTSKANYNDVPNHPTDVGSYPDNPYGLYDMSGNIEEWCHDYYSTYTEDSLVNPGGSTTDSMHRRMHRGGYFLDGAPQCTSFVRDNRAETAGGSYSIAFRVVQRAYPQMY